MLRFTIRKAKSLFWLSCSFLLVLTFSYIFLFHKANFRSSLKRVTPSYEIHEHRNEKVIERSTSKDSNVQSAWTCSGNMNYESEWHRRTCAFKNICYNKEKNLFQFYRKPGNIRKPILFEPKLGHIYDFNINNHGFVGLMARASPRESWGPTIIEESPPSVDRVPYLEHVHVLFMHWHVSFNPGHVIWEDIASTYSAMVRLNEYDRNAVLLEYQNFPNKGDQFHKMYQNLVPAFAAQVDSLDHYMSNFSSSVVCFQTVVAGGAMTMFSIDNEPYTHGKERILYDYRTAILRYHGVDTSRLPTRHRIVLINKTRALRRSLRGIMNLMEVKQFIQSAYPNIQLDVIDWSKYTFAQQMHELYQTTILITPCGGISMAIPFLPTGTHAIIMDFYVNKNAYLSWERYEEGTSGSMDAALFNYFPHIRKLYYQVRGAEDYILDFPGASNTRHDASVSVNTTRLQELINTALEESSIDTKKTSVSKYN